MRRLCDRPAARVSAGLPDRSWLYTPRSSQPGPTTFPPATLFPTWARGFFFGEASPLVRRRIGLDRQRDASVFWSSVRTSLHGPAEVALRRRECRHPRSAPEDRPHAATRAQGHRDAHSMRDDALASSQLSSAVKVPSSSSWTSWDPHAQEARRSETEKHAIRGSGTALPTPRREALSGELPPRFVP